MILLSYVWSFVYVVFLRLFLKFGRSVQVAYFCWNGLGHVSHVWTLRCILDMHSFQNKTQFGRSADFVFHYDVHFSVAGVLGLALAHHWKAYGFNELGGAHGDAQFHFVSLGVGVVFFGIALTSGSCGLQGEKLPPSLRKCCSLPKS